MPFGDGIDAKHSFSLTDFHEFDYCSFRFFVRHHLGKKYELEEGNEAFALGILLDQSIKFFHKSKAYGQPAVYLKNIVRAAVNFITDKVGKSSGPSFYSSTAPFLTDDLIKKATKIFQDYYLILDKKIKKSLGEVGFCEWVINNAGNAYKLWGGPDAFELGNDGVPEVVDYKSREDIEKGKQNMDMDLMPKIYILLSANYLKKKGYKKARFVARFWQDPKEDKFYEEFDLENLYLLEQIFKEKIEKILSTKEIKFCNKDFCRACQSDKKEQYLYLLEKMGLLGIPDDYQIK